MEPKTVSLDDKYRLPSGRVVVNGTQALLLAMMRQRRFDRMRGFNTAGFISGYRGSPLSSLDTEAWNAAVHLRSEDIRFHPGINEDLALTSIWGAQQTALDPRAKVEGVFALWYGKGAGLDRCGDVLRHAHGAGSSRRGGVLIVSGDDHALKSSSQAYHSEPTFIDMQMPVIAPADVQELLDYAILGWEMSRHSGCYVGFKVLPEHTNATAVVDIGVERISAVHPEVAGPRNDRWIRWPDPWPEVERRLIDIKLPAALAFARVNGLNRIIVKGSKPRLGIVTGGKCYLDLLQALARLGISQDEAGRLGISIYKIGMPWPADETALAAFCRGHATILVIEEKRDLIETQVRSALYSLPDPERPIVLGRRDRQGHPAFPLTGEIGSDAILKVLTPEIAGWLDESRRAQLEVATHQVPPPPAVLGTRTPYFCSGCPHNSSTKVPDGSKALGGVGCHFMATAMDRNTDTFTHMGGEGATWIGTAPFTDTPHVFVNLGEGTYFHSGSLAIRAAVAAGANITYKILYNDAIAMTGGQPVDGQLTVNDIVRQVQAEGVERVEIVADDVDSLTPPYRFRVSGRDKLQDIQKALRETPGVSVLIYYQACATEKRRRRKRGKMAPAPRRVLINERVCEGCGDCSVQSNCLSVTPVETEFGRKRLIDQTSCNQDYSCVDGFCPSFVTIDSARLRTPPQPLATAGDLPEPVLPRLKDGNTYDILVAGIGGTGIVTVSALLGMAAHLEGQYFTVYDKLGMAQKYGSVNGHLRIAASPNDLDSVKLARASARVLISGDLRVAAEPALLDLMDRDRGSLIVAEEQAVGGEFALNPDYDFKSGELRASLKRFAKSRVDILPAREFARTFLGDEVGANLLLLGFAWQKGLIPISRAAIERAIELNGVAVPLNKAAFALGRNYAHAPETIANGRRPKLELPHDMTWRELADRRAAQLEQYQDREYAQRYLRLVDRVAHAEADVLGAPGALAHAVAENFAKLLAYKDEYEVARLYTDGAFQKQLAETFEDSGRLSFYLAPPIIGGRDPSTGRPRKRRFGPWILHVFRVLARMKALRGTMFDPFGRHRDRREERELIRQYEDDLIALAATLRRENHAALLTLAKLPRDVRGYGPVKQQSVETARLERQRILDELTDMKPSPPNNPTLEIPIGQA
jgi:indolepyruvate ferredoxin oxidoreductase